MFGKLTKKHIKGIFWALAILIIPSFVIWGSNYRGDKQTGLEYAGVIFGKKVPIQRYLNNQAALGHTFIINGAARGEQPDAFTLNQLTWDRLITLAEAKKRRINVSDKEVMNAILKMPFFRFKGIFDKRLYREILQSTFLITERQFEEEIREALIIEKLYQNETARIKLSSEYVLNKYTEQNEKISFNYIEIDTQSIENYKPTKEEIAKYYSQNINKFQHKIRSNIQYIGLPYPAGASLETKNKIKERIVAISKQINEKSNLEQIAKENKLELKETGLLIVGENYIKDKNSIEEIAAISIFLEQNDITPAIEINNGYYILKIKEKNKDYNPSIEESNQAVEKTIVKEKTKAMNLSKARETYERLIVGQETKPKLNFKQLGESLGLKVNTTETFTRKTKKIDSLGSIQELEADIFKLKMNEISTPLELNSKYYIFSLNKISGIDMAKFEQEKDAFAKSATEEAKIKAEENLLEKLRRDSKLIDYITASRNN
jgi:peptidyl-prolyl cis-trans isomerase D